MFKKLKDKLAEEVKSSPQRIQQFAQAAQAAVTSASSSISDITNNDLFSIGDNENNQQNKAQKSSFQSVTLTSPSSQQPAHDPGDFQAGTHVADYQRQRRLSNSSFTSDVSFKLPSYESPSMYHLQSDMDVSASEAEDRVFAPSGGGGGGPASLDRVTKEQLYTAYRRTQERYAKYRTQYADLAKHYKILERENAKARSVLVETQDKALRRISELREQCSLEQSAKAHLEQALREEIDEKNMNIEALNTKVGLLQNKDNNVDDINRKNEKEPGEPQPLVEQLVNLADEADTNQNSVANDTQETKALTIKIEKLEQLVNKYKDTVKSLKDKNAQYAIDVEKFSNELKTKAKDSEDLISMKSQLSHAQDEIASLKNINEEIQNKLNTYDFKKTKESTTMEVDLQKALEEVTELKSKISVYSKREEDYAISLAENKLSIHKELEGKEAEIKTLKECLAESKQEVQSLTIVVNDYKQQIATLEENRTTLNTKINELNVFKTVVTQLETDLAEIKQKCHNLEQSKLQCDQENKCLLLQIKQEVAEKMAIIDRNSYLEDRNKHLTEENIWKNEKINSLENELQQQSQDDSSEEDSISEWKEKCYRLETEINEEREELIKLQAEIEKMMENHNFIQSENKMLHKLVKDLQLENNEIKHNSCDKAKLAALKSKITSAQTKITELRKYQRIVVNEIETMCTDYKNSRINLEGDLLKIFKTLHHTTEISSKSREFETIQEEKQKLVTDFTELKQQLELTENEKLELRSQNKSLSEQISATELKWKQFGNIQEEKHKLEIDLTELKQQLELSENEKLELRSQNETLSEQVSATELKWKQLDNNFTTKIDELIAEKNKLKKLCDEGLESRKQLMEALKSNKEMENEVKNISHRWEEMSKLNSVLEDEKHKLKQELDSLKSKYDKKSNEIMLLEENSKKHNEFEDQNAELKKRITSLESNNHDLLEAKETLQDEYKLLQLNLKRLSVELEEKIQSSIETATLKSNEQSDDQKQELTSLQAHVNNLSEENELLKTKCEQIKQEKETLYENLMKTENRLSELENKQQELEKYRLQIADSELRIEVLEKENINLKEQNKMKNNTLSEHESMEKEYEIIKQDNRRLQSDIDGLQIYLAKISKENSSLNDQLRDQIASSEHIERDYSSPLNEVKKVQEEAHSEKCNINDLLRENSLLVEENLELKDQLSSLTDTRTEKLSTETDANKQSQLFSRVANLEELNTSANMNIKELQDTNQKLRYSNEKLERRLDEALVSLRHLHSLQENTELEYLKNILFEYLTGSGEHSLTLAKVVSAVVKFDDSQTAAIMRKEKERQGLLRQLGLL